MRRLVWADEASEGEQPLEQVLEIPARPFRGRVVSATRNPVVFCVMVSGLLLFLVAFWGLPLVRVFFGGA